MTTTIKSIKYKERTQTWSQIDGYVVLNVQYYPWLNTTGVHWPWTCNAHPKQHNSGKCVFSYDPNQHTAQDRERVHKKDKCHLRMWHRNKFPA